METLQIHVFTEIKDGETIHEFDTSKIPTDLISKVVPALVFDLLARSGVKYEYTELERRFKIGIDYFRALDQAVNARKTLIEVDFVKEREKQHQRYLQSCKDTGVDPHQIFIDFPINP